MIAVHRLAIASAVIVLGLAAAPSTQQPPAPVQAAPSGLELRTEYAANPIGIDVREPRLSWRMRSAARGAVQTAYQIHVAPSERALRSGKGLSWDSGIVKSAESVHVTYAGPALGSGQRCYWRVRIWDGSGTPSAWSETAFWEMGLLLPSDWKGEWIEPDLPEDIKTSGPSPMLRREFVLKNEVERARAYVTSRWLRTRDAFIPGLSSAKATPSNCLWEIGCSMPRS